MRALWSLFGDQLVWVSRATVIFMSGTVVAKQRRACLACTITSEIQHDFTSREMEISETLNTENEELNRSLETGKLTRNGESFH